VVFLEVSQRRELLGVSPYRILIHPGPGDKAVLEKEYQEFAK
jgi:hypothetical protein